MAIRMLDDATVSRIAAGEVVERPASVLKELIENSLDADASTISVEIRDGGAPFMRVADNGRGIAPEEAKMAFLNHATSKISSGDALDDIRTLGFRGEALPSIAAVARVTMTTRMRGAQSGVKLEIEGGRIVSLSEVGCPDGTTITVKDLFFNTPARREFLKKPATEAGVVADMFARLILGNPSVSMKLVGNGRTVYSSYGDGDLRHAALAVYGREFAAGLVDVDEAEGGLRLRGLVGLGEQSHANRSRELFFINKRTVRCQMLSQTLENVCKGLVLPGQYPSCALSVDMPSASVDVNVHPNKLEVRFRDETSFRISTDILLRRALIAAESGTMLDAARLTKAETSPNDAPGSTIVVSAPQEKASVDHTAEPTQVRFSDVSKTIKQTEVDNAAQPQQTKQTEVLDEKLANVRARLREELPLSLAEGMALNEDFVQIPPPEAGDGNAPQSDVEFSVIGCFMNTYLLVEAGDTLIIIDQHAAHERILYQMLERRYAHDGTMSQRLLTPLIVEMSPREQALLLEESELLREAGYSLEPFGERDVRVWEVPFILGKAELKPLFVELVDRLDQLKGAASNRVREELMQMACKKAVKAGDALTEAEIAALIAEMRTTDSPATCPHGRPVMKVFRKNEIERMFRRT